MVSAKCTFQLSRSSTLASAAAIPPSAITVCALPRSDLQTRPTETPAADASIAARNPAPPAPMTMTSCSWVSYLSAIGGFLLRSWRLSKLRDRGDLRERVDEDGEHEHRQCEARVPRIPERERREH